MATASGRTSMLAIAISRPGGPDVLQAVERPVPSPASDEVLIRVAAAGINRPDILQRLGGYAPPPGASDVFPGLEVAGRVDAVGRDVTDWQVGDAVCALIAGGGYAEYCVAPGVQCLPIPRGLDLVQSAALPETFFTVWTNVFERGCLRAGEWLLVHGGSSGIGTTAIQLGAAFGARVLATAGSDEKCRACEALGAAHAINYRVQDFVTEVRAATDARGVDLILDMVGGDYFARNVECLAVDGRLVQIAYLQGYAVPLDLRPLMQKRLTITGSTLRPRTPAQKGLIARALEARVWPLLAEGRVRPQVYATFPLIRAADAHRLMESSAHIGKIVLTINGAEGAHGAQGALGARGAP